MITSSIIIFCLVRDLLLSIWRTQGAHTITESEEKPDGTRSRLSREAHEAGGQGTVVDNAVTVEEKGISDQSPITHSTQITGNVIGLGTSNPSMRDQHEMERLSVVNPAVSKGFLENLDSKKIFAAQCTQLGQSQNVTGKETLEKSHQEEEQWAWDNYYEENCHVSSDTNSDKKDCNMSKDEQIFERNCPESYDIVSERDWLYELEALSVSDLAEETVAGLRRAFDSSHNPFSLVLYIVRFAAFDYCSNKKSLAYITLMEFEKWLDEKTQGLSEMEQCNLGLVPTDELKDSALEIVITSKLMLFEPIKNIYQLDCKNNGFLEKHVRFLLHSRNKYKEAVVMATKLHLQTHFEPSEILLPLIIQDKVQLTERYVSECPWQQKAYLAMLNRLCGLTDEELENIARSTVTPAYTPKNHKLTQKALVKLSERLVKMFNLDPEEYPNVFKGKNLNGLLFLLKKKYSERGLSATKKWDNLIETSIGGNQWLQLKLVECIVDLGDIDEAVRWSRYFDLPVPSLPADVQEVLEYQEGDLDQEDWEAEIEGKSEPRQPELEQTLHQPQAQYFHQLSLPWERIHIIEDAPSLQECLSRLCQPGTVVGFDAEWRPTMCRAGTNNKLAVIQLATHSEVFILDMIAILDSVPQKLLEEFGEWLFANPNILKLGYGVESDFQVLVSSCPVLKTHLRNVQRFVDLCPVSKEVLNLPHVKHKLQKSSRFVSPAQLEKGLSELVCHCLGRPLDKTYQVSDWERRPLMPDQLIYAALDAYCLLEVYDVLRAWVRESKTPVNMEPELPPWKWLFPERKRTATQKRKRLKPGTEPTIFLPPINTGPPVAPGSVAIVVDTMLQGLGRQLRCCGVDVVIPECNASHRQLVEIARREERSILTCGTRSYNRLRSQVPEGMCMCVPAGTIREQVTVVFRYFNVKVTTSDLFSRCQVCNGREYTKISAEHMRIAYHVAHGLVDPYSVHVTSDTPIDYLTLTINHGVPLKVATIPEEVLSKDRVFYCCSKCGRVFWEGSHFKTVQTQFAYIVDQSGSAETIYTK